MMIHLLLYTGVVKTVLFTSPCISLFFFKFRSISVSLSITESVSIKSLWQFDILWFEDTCIGHPLIHCNAMKTKNGTIYTYHKGIENCSRLALWHARDKETKNHIIKNTSDVCNFSSLILNDTYHISEYSLLYIQLQFFFFFIINKKPLELIKSI